MKTQLALAAAAAALLSACAPTAVATRVADASLPQQNDPYFQAGAARAAAQAEPARAKNVILFVGDGMGVATITAARIYAGQEAGVDGESYELTMDKAPHLAHSRTYSTDHQIADSAATAAALTTGVKTRSGVLGLTGAVPLGTCPADASATARTIFEIAEAAGLSTGVVSTARITHATPAAAYSHISHRDWENDAVAAHSGGAACTDIARQLVEWPAGDGFEIVLGGGRANFLPSSMNDPEGANVKGARADGRDLTAEWAAKPGHAFVWNTAQLAATNAPHVLGLFSPSHMAYESQRARDTGGEPSLSEMTAAAINHVKNDPDGYVLLIEGGRVDHAHHEGRAREALSEAVALDNAIKTALEMTSRDDTLMVVTADHSHVLTISGYAHRGNPILGLSNEEDAAGTARGTDGKPYTTLGYMNGPGATAEPRADLSNVDTTAWDFHQQALVPMYAETHGGEDVAFFAWGPGSAGFAGTIEQNVAFHLMARALGLAE